MINKFVSAEAAASLIKDGDTVALIGGGGGLCEASCLHAAIETLPPMQRTLLTLYHLDEMPIGQIAEMTGLAEGTIKSHLFRSRQRLRQVLETRMGVAA